MKSKIVLCLDGTWNSPFTPVEREDHTTVLKPTNPLKLSRSILPFDAKTGDRQLTYYDSGVGAIGLYPGLSNKLLNFFDSKLGGMWGAGFEANIEQAVTFLTMNYTPGDDVFIFGFSRGAAQARSLTRFIDWLGGVPQKDDAYYIPLFFAHYLKTQGQGLPSDIQSSEKNKPHERVQSLSVLFLGVWDTVMALGSRFKATKGTTEADRSFHTGIKPASNVINAWQGLAIDEKRYDFRPEIWKEHESGQTLQQRWFAGAHGNVGGSYGNDGLANISLHWIVDRAKELGLAVDETFLKHYKPYLGDELSNEHGFIYKSIEAIRFRRNYGIRPLINFPKSACLILDRSVIKRLCSDPTEHKKMTGVYRPENVIEFIRQHRDDLDGFLISMDLDPSKWKIPDDVLKIIQPDNIP